MLIENAPLHSPKHTMLHKATDYLLRLPSPVRDTLALAANHRYHCECEECLIFWALLQRYERPFCFTQDELWQARHVLAAMIAAHRVFVDRESADLFVCFTSPSHPNESYAYNGAWWWQHADEKGIEDIPWWDVPADILYFDAVFPPAAGPNMWYGWEPAGDNPAIEYTIHVPGLRMLANRTTEGLPTELTEA